MMPPVSFVPIAGHARTQSRRAALSVLAADPGLFSRLLFTPRVLLRGTSLASRQQRRGRLDMCRDKTKTHPAKGERMRKVSKMKRRKSKGFTLIELLVVVAI